MPRYYFDTDDGDVRYGDEVGVELLDQHAARWEAIRVLPSMARDKLPSGDRCILAVRVREEDGRAIYAATFDLTGEWLVDPPPS